jgi:hypothetical protein
MNTSLRSISQFNILKRCANFFLPLLSFALPESRLDVLQMWMMNLKNLTEQGVNQICRGGLVVSASLQVMRSSFVEAWTNKRFRVGVLVGMVAFPAWKCHLFFDINARDFDWYYVNWVFYLNTIRPYLAGIFLSAGLFFAAPQKWQFRWWALPVVIFCMSEITAQTFYNDWTDFHQPMPAWELCLLILFSAPALFKGMDYLLYRKYHLKDGNVSRIIGVIEMDVAWSEKEKTLKQLAKEFRDYNARV